MTRQDTKSVAQKTIKAARSGSSRNATKAAVVTSAKKAASKKTLAKKPVASAKNAAEKRTVSAVEGPKKSEGPTSKRIPTHGQKKKASATKAADVMARPATKKTSAKPTPEERYRMVETAAYFIAEQHGFEGRSDEHWAAAEREIAAKLDL